MEIIGTMRDEKPVKLLCVKKGGISERKMNLKKKVRKIPDLYGGTN